MNKISYCEQCNSPHENYFCDTCGLNLTIDCKLPIELSFGYGSGLDGEEYQFCSLKCISDFINAECAKGEE
jgi:YHS domain-containing protein